MEGVLLAASKPQGVTISAVKGTILCTSTICTMFATVKQIRTVVHGALIVVTTENNRGIHIRKYSYYGIGLWPCSLNQFWQELIIISKEREKGERAWKGEKVT